MLLWSPVSRDIGGQFFTSQQRTQRMFVKAKERFNYHNYNLAPGKCADMPEDLVHNYTQEVDEDKRLDAIKDGLLEEITKEQFTMHLKSLEAPAAPEAPKETRRKAAAD